MFTYHSGQAPSLTLAAAAALLVACGGAPPATSPAQGSKSAPAAATPAAPAPAFDLEAEMKREASGLTEQGVMGADRSWKAKPLAAAAPQVSVVESVGMVEIPIGSDAAVRCQVFPEALDPASTLFNVFKTSSGKVEYRQIKPDGIQLLAGNPAAFVDALYVTDASGGGKAAGHLKIAVLSREDRALLCIHDELGFRETFHRVATAFFESFQLAAPIKSNATYLEITSAKLDDLPVGFSVTQLLPSEKPGEREYHNLSTRLVPASAKDLVFQDSFNITRYDAKGRIIEENYADVTQGEISMKLKLTRGANGKYQYEGLVDGKALKGELKAPRGVATLFETAALIKKKLKAGGPFELKQDEYQPSVDPTATVVVTYAHAKGAPARQVTMSIGDRTVTTEVDDEGLPKSGWFMVGQRKLTMERLRVDGHP